MKKAFQAANELVAVKIFIADADPIPDGWFATAKEALASYSTVKVESTITERTPDLPESSDSAPRKRGRPRRVQTQ